MKPPAQKNDKAELDVYRGFCNKAGTILITYWRLYPDRFLALLEAEKPDFVLAPIQVIMLRAECRYQSVSITGGRGASKSYIGLLSRMILGVLFPGIQQQYFGPILKQTCSILSDQYKQIKKNYPTLAGMYRIIADSEERFDMRTAYGTVICADIMRGSNAHTCLAEETAQAEAGKQFDHESFGKAVLPAIRKDRLVNQVIDKFFPNFQKVYVTSGGSQQNPAYQYHLDTIKEVVVGGRAFAIDIPGCVAVLNGIRNIIVYEELKRKLTPLDWLREVAALWTGTCVNPIIRDAILAESKNVIFMENRHCGDYECIYIVSYDVSYADGAQNAKCATSVLKLTEQKEMFKRDRYLKQFVYVMDEDPCENMLQAQKLKQRWYHFCLEGGGPTYIAIDARSYGQAVLENLHKDLGDGLPPLCCVNHSRNDIELEGALPVIYSINASGGYSVGYRDDHDSETEMLRYAELEWEHGNVKLLTPKISEGIAAYKRLHKIKDDLSDATIAIPYIKTRELTGQISNLRKKQSGTGLKEERISRSIQRDMWSASKYALRIAQRLEYQNLITPDHKSDVWQEYYKNRKKSDKSQSQEMMIQTGFRPRVINRVGGNMIGRKRM